MPPEAHQPGTPAEWMRHARSDLALARTDLPPSVLPEVFCFHAQQAAEKAIKAVLVSRDISFPMAHNIGTLLDLLPESLAIPEELQEAATLTDYAVSTRYPGIPEPVDTAELREAIRLATAVVTWAEGITGQE